MTPTDQVGAPQMVSPLVCSHHEAVRDKLNALDKADEQLRADVREIFKTLREDGERALGRLRDSASLDKSAKLLQITQILMAVGIIASVIIGVVGLYVKH